MKRTVAYSILLWARILVVAPYDVEEKQIQRGFSFIASASASPSAASAASARFRQ